MKKNRFNKNIPGIITILLNMLLIVAVFFLMNYVQTLLYSDVQINLTEIVTQNKDVITSKLKVELNNLDMISNNLEERLKMQHTYDKETIKKTFLDYCGDTKLNNAAVSDTEGFATLADGQPVDISGRSYFRLALQGIQNISDRLTSRATGEEIFIISVPLRYQGNIIGTVQKYYSSAEMYQLCSLSLFSDRGNMYIINSEGYILISSNQNDYSKESENYYRMLYSQGNQDASKSLERDIKSNRAGFMETTVRGEKMFSAYTPIDDLHDWYLISSIATSAVSSNANRVVKLFYVILLVVVLIFAVSILYFLSYKNKQQTALGRIAFVDSVTQGDTYNKFTVDFGNALQEHPDKEYYLFTFDIDNFKYINSFYGFDFGDRILKRIYWSVKERLNAEEQIARISGDHFAVLLEDASEERILKLMDSIREEGGIMLYVSAGLYAVSDHQESISLMMDKANTAAQKSKGVLHNNVEIYSEKDDEAMIRNEQMKRSVEAALLNNEMIPFYQPKTDINSGKLVGAEALARWINKEGKLISPAEFIPVCEKTGMIVELDMMIFEKVLSFLDKNLKQGITCMPISVNFSRLHLADKDFHENIAQKMRMYSVPPELIEIELTESMLFDNHETILSFISKLHEMGFLISMDDFGTGYSSLNMLKDIPIDVLKIDKGFLEETENNKRRNIIFASIVEMAKQLQIMVVTEGVETKKDVELMKECGCSIAQGFYFARPMPEKEFQTLFKGGKVC